MGNGAVQILTLVLALLKALKCICILFRFKLQSYVYLFASPHMNISDWFENIKQCVSSFGNQNNYDCLLDGIGIAS